MKAVVFHAVGDIRVDDVPDPTIQDPNDAIVRLTASAICGTDLHFVRGTMAGMRPGTILGHEGVGIVEEVGPNVRNLRPGDRVVIASTIGCGFCTYCRAGYYAQCDTTEPKGGTAFFGGPEAAGGDRRDRPRSRDRCGRRRRRARARGPGRRAHRDARLGLRRRARPDRAHAADRPAQGDRRSRDIAG